VVGITERHEQTRALELMTSPFDMAIRAAGVGVWSIEITADGERLWCSDTLCEMFGQDPAVFRPTRERWLALVHPDDRERLRATSGAAGRPRASRSIQYRVVRSDGAVRHVESIEATTGQSEGTAHGMAGIVIDITARVESAERERGLQAQLRASSHRAGMAEIATGVLHNVGNVLNSLGVASATARRHFKALRLSRLGEAASLISSHRATLAAFLTEDERGRYLPDYLAALSPQLAANAEAVRAEMRTIDKLLQHLRDIVGAQQALARIGGSQEPIHLHELVEAALLMQELDLGQIDVVRRHEALPPITTDRHKLLQILVNLVSNARDAVHLGTARPGRIVVRLHRDGDEAVISVEDSGIGMSGEVLSRLWQFGFTTKQNGHGFGLHNCANAAREIGATIEARSDGPGKGACFTLRLPLVRQDREGSA
jgi:PAS domain S-box-containing protein